MIDVRLRARLQQGIDQRDIVVIDRLLQGRRAVLLAALTSAFCMIISAQPRCRPPWRLQPATAALPRALPADGNQHAAIAAPDAHQTTARSHRLQISAILPVLSPSLSTGTPARSSIVSSTFASGV